MNINAKFTSESQLKELLDRIYAASQQGQVFHGIFKAAFNEVTIISAIHKLKGNSGASTSGVDGKVMRHYLEVPRDELIGLVRRVAGDYHPRPARLIRIPKANGKMRPLGIPTMMDRIVQECIRTILDPIAEGRFYPQSYGFRPYRSPHHAVTAMVHTINSSDGQNQAIWAIEGDIRSFFDNINHRVLMMKL